MRTGTGRGTAHHGVVVVGAEHDHVQVRGVVGHADARRARPVLPASTHTLLYSFVFYILHYTLVATYCYTERTPDSLVNSEGVPVTATVAHF